MKNILIYKNIFVELVKSYASKPTGTIWTVLTFASVFFGSGYIGSTKLTIANLQAENKELKAVIKGKDMVIDSNSRRESNRLNAIERKYEELREKTNELNKKVKK